MKKIRHWLKLNLIALLAVGLALTLKFLLRNSIGKETPFLLFFTAIILTAYYGGKQAGLLATALSALVSNFFFLTPIHSFLGIKLGDIPQLSFFLMEGLSITYIIDGLHTARKKAELMATRLQESEEQFSSFMDNLPGVAFIKDKDFRHIYLNEAGLDLFNWKADEWYLKNNDQLFPAATAEQLNQHDYLVIQERKPLQIIEKISQADGIHYYLVNKFPLVNQRENLLTVGGIAIDITERIKSEEALKQALQKSNFHVDNSPLAIVEWDNKFRISRWSQQAEHIFGWKSEEVLGKHPDEWKFVFIEDVDRVNNEIIKLCKGIEQRNLIVNKNYTKNGKIVSCEWYNSALLDDRGKLVSVLSLVLDISDRQQAEVAALKAAERTFRLQTVTASLSAAITPAQVANVIVEQALSALEACRGIVTLLNDNGTELEIVGSIGYTTDILESWSTFSINKSVPLAEAVRTKKPIFIESLASAIDRYQELPLKQNTVHDGALAAIPLIVETKVLGALGLVFTETRKFSEEDCKLIIALVSQCAQAIQRAQLYNAEKKARSEAEANEQRFRFLAESIPQIVWTAQSDGYTDYYNQRWFDYTGITLEQSKSIGAVHFRHPDDRERCVEQWLKALANKDIFQVEQRLRRVDGVYRWHLTRAKPMLDENGQIIKWFGTCTDIDDWKRAEDTLKEANERLKLLSETASNLLLQEQPEDLIASLFKKLSVHLKLEVYLNYLIQPEERGIYLHSYGGLSEEFYTKVKGLEFSQTVCGAVALNQKPIVVENIQDSTDRATEIMRSQGITAYACYPLIAGNQLIGTLGFGTRNRPSFATDELELMEVVCNQVATALERQRLILQLQQQTKELANANRRKDEFLAVLSHELRTPLNSMLGWAKLLRSRKYDEATTNRALETIERNATSQAQLIEDILDVSRIIQGKLRIQSIAVNLVSSIETAIDTVRSSANTKNIQIVEMLPPQSLQVMGDPDRLQQIIWNLLSNAIKFTPQGGQIKICLDRVDSNAEIAISDTGCGISPDFIPYVFDRFRQADSSNTRTHGGLGLGLAIVKHLVELHGGTINAGSGGEGQGSTFTIKLPLLPSSTDTGRQQKDFIINVESNLARSLDGLQVLVVDDEPDARQLLKVVLEESGASVTAVASVKEAIAAINQLKLDLLISDIGMPIEDGYSLIRKIRSWQSEHQNIPAIALTAYASEEDSRQALLAGFQTHIPKPLNPISLVEEVAKLAGSSKYSRE